MRLLLVWPWPCVCVCLRWREMDARHGLALVARCVHVANAFSISHCIVVCCLFALFSLSQFPKIVKYVSKREIESGVFVSNGAQIKAALRRMHRQPHNNNRQTVAQRQFSRVRLNGLTYVRLPWTASIRNAIRYSVRLADLYSLHVYFCYYYSRCRFDATAADTNPQFYLFLARCISTILDKN